MRIFGIALMAIGALIVVLAFKIDTTVANASDYLSGRTHNLGLLQQQMMVLHTGLAMFVAGSFFAANSLPKMTASDALATRPAREEGSASDSPREVSSLETDVLGWSSLKFAALLLGAGGLLVIVVILVR